MLLLVTALAVAKIIPFSVSCASHLVCGVRLCNLRGLHCRLLVRSSDTQPSDPTDEQFIGNDVSPELPVDDLTVWEAPRLDDSVFTRSPMDTSIEMPLEME